MVLIRLPIRPSRRIGMDAVSECPGTRRACFTLLILVGSMAASITSITAADDAVPAETAARAGTETAISSSLAAPAAKPSGGKLVICGGGVLPIQLRNRFMELAGGPIARIVVITTASVYADTDKMESKLGFWHE